VWALVALVVVQLALGAPRSPLGGSFDPRWCEGCVVRLLYSAGESDVVDDHAESWIGLSEGAGVAASAKVSASAKAKMGAKALAKAGAGPRRETLRAPPWRSGHTAIRSGSQCKC